MKLEEEFEGPLKRLRTLLAETFKSQKRDLAAMKEVDSILKTLKLKLLDLRCLVPVSSDSDEQHESSLIEEWIVAREVLEWAFLSTVMRENAQGFQRAFEELNGVYFNPFVLQELYVSPRQPLTMGLGLLFYLATDALDKFHILLRKIEAVDKAPAESSQSIASTGDATMEDAPAAESNDFAGVLTDLTFFGVKATQLSAADASYLGFPLELGRHLMDGNISRIMAISSGSVPHPTYKWLSERFVSTVRDYVASALQASYEEVSVAYAMKAMAIPSMERLRELIREKTRMNEAAQQALDFEGMKDLSESLVDLDHLHSMEQLPARGVSRAPVSLVSKLLGGKGDHHTDVLAGLAGTTTGDANSAYNIALFSSMATKPVATVRWVLTNDEKTLKFQRIRESVVKKSKALALQQFTDYAADYEAIV